MPSYLITGASRGLGYEFLSQISVNPSNTVVGLVRNKPEAEAKVKTLNRSNVHIVQGDLEDFDSLKKSVDQVSAIVNGSLDYLIANAGYISSWSAYDSLSTLGDDPKRLEDDLLKCFRVNTIGNIHLINLYLPLVLKGDVKKVIVLSSGFADDELTTNFNIGEAGPYTISKSAMNTAVAKYSAEYAEQGVLFLSIAPGAVEVGQDAGITEEQIPKAMALGGKFAGYAPHFKGRTMPEESIKDMLLVINKASVKDGYGGSFISHKGNKQWL
ncbi:unnamed protein product [Clonostachys rosea f. rosea IK726]|uniref:NAD(P)-binding protein n=2 Tax=Bionectria ochroleuca TaxID=29856 RepID=A0A0B7KL26_BIOOC|nr:unnamed protein product [Clonostachys rosea f. rosea IK726]